MTMLEGPPRELGGKRTYTTTGKEPEPYGDKIDLACWFLMSKMDDSIAGPATISDIYYQVTRPMGMSAYETSELVKACKNRGYLRWGS